MGFEKTLAVLQKYQNVPFPLLSVYLDNREGKKGKELLEDFQRLVHRQLTGSEQGALQNEIMEISSYLETLYGAKGKHPNIAFFTGDSLWEVILHEYDVPAKCTVSHAADIAPLQNELWKERRYLFVVADREKADIFTLRQGEVEKYMEIVDQSVPQKVKSNKEENYARNSRILRHIQVHLNRAYSADNG